MNRKQRRVEKKLGAAGSEAPRMQEMFAEAAGHHNAGRFAEAGQGYRRILVQDPDHAASLDGLGLIAFWAGQPAAAAELLRKAIAASPNTASSHMHLGLALRAEGKGDEALACYHRALALQPDYFEAQANLANLLWNQGRLAEADASYRRLLKIRPQDVLALNNFAALRLAQHDYVGAMNLTAQSLQVRETPRGKKLFCDLARLLQWTGCDAGTRAVMVRALTEPWTRPARLAQVAGDLLKLDPVIGAAIARAAEAWPQYLSASERYGSDTLAALGADPLLQALLGATHNTDIAMEYFLTMARRLLLQAAMTPADDPPLPILNFYAALARQCFINEYVFCQSAEESRDAETLRGRVAAAIADAIELPAISVVAFAAYIPLHALPNAERLLERSWPAPLAALLRQQISEPLEEKRLRAAIPQLTPIEDATSKSVQAQYEEYPYPRWVKAQPAEQNGTIFFDLAQKFPIPHPRPDTGKGADILIAGCGTGQNAVEMALEYRDARFLAVDLSLTSLSYAARMTQMLGLTSISYAQGDILALGGQGPRFDIIESSGVLHHMAEPFAGWQALLSCLRPGGLMRLGFYSRIGRRNIAKARQYIARRGFAATPEGIRQCRQELLALSRSEDYAATVSSEDFFSISACRDLLFHVQEHQFELSDIAAFLRDNNLAFLGFVLPDAVRQAYVASFPGDPMATDLGNWQRFEEVNPSLFFSMYQFWIQKPP